MFFRVVLLIGIVSVLSYNLSFASNDDLLLAKAGDHVFRQSDYQRLMNYSPPQLQKQLQENPEQRVLLIEKIMQSKIISGIARKEGFDKKDEVREQMQYIIDDLLAGEYLKKMAADEKKKIVLRDDELREFYRANANIFTIPEQVKARHILIKVPKDASEEKKKEAREKAKDIYKKLKQGEDFEKLAEQYSEDASNKSKGGDLGYILRGQMEKPFEDAAFSLKPGEYSYIVETSRGFHIIFSETHINERLKTFDEVRDLIDKQVKERVAGAQLKEMIKKISKDAGLEIYRDSIIGKKSDKE